ncbi:MAG: DUF4258 domain-containing protein [Planctomycetota bacterium]
MDARARQALRIIRRCMAQRRFGVLPHFRKRMARRGLFWTDVQAVLDDPSDVRSGGRDRFFRPKWLVAGVAADGEDIVLVCVLDVDEHGDLTVYITIY